MINFQTEQEQFWAGQFGDDYVARNQGQKIVAGNLALFGKVFGLSRQVSSVLELGANVGLNLIAIKQLLPQAAIAAVEINPTAVAELNKLGFVQAHHQSILDFKADGQMDFVFTKGVLIHINPDYLPKVYETMYQSSSRYIFLAEYYNPSPVEISYRGHSGKLFKRDFAGELLTKYPDLILVDYGFVYHKDPNFPQDDLTWFLLEKR